MNKGLLDEEQVSRKLWGLEGKEGKEMTTEVGLVGDLT